MNPYEKNYAEWIKKNRAVILLTAVNVIYFIVLMAAGAIGNTAKMVQCGAICMRNGSYQGGIGPLFQAMFMHFDLYHLGSNLLIVILIGSYLEKRIGSLKVLAAYLLTGLAGNAGSIWWYAVQHATVVSAGASGAAYGMVAVFCTLLLKEKRGGDPGMKRRMGFMIFLMIYSGMKTPGINLSAHIFGFLAGLLLGGLGILMGRRR